MPSPYYVYNYDVPGGGILCIVYVDTVLIDPYQHDTSAILNLPNWQELRQDHLDWIEQVLAEQNQTATWLLVAGHYPIYSIGDSGDNEDMIELLLPILKRSNVHAYICGHDHNHQHIHMDNFHFFVDGSGGGRGPLGPNGLRHLGTSAATHYMRNYFVNCGFSVVEVTVDTLKVNFVDNLGKTRYTAVLDTPHNSGYYKAKSIAGVSSVFASHATVSVILVLGILAVPISIVAVYTYFKMNEHPVPTVRESTAIDISTRSNAALFNSKHSDNA